MTLERAAWTAGTIPMAEPMTAVGGGRLAEVTTTAGQQATVRCHRWVPGIPATALAPSPAMGADVGRSLAALYALGLAAPATTALQVLGERGHRVVDTDTGQWSHWVRLPDGSTDWVWREDAITALLADHRQGALFVAGCKRDNNPYGKKPEEQALILAAPGRDRAAPASHGNHRDRCAGFGAGQRVRRRYHRCMSACEGELGRWRPTGRPSPQG